MKLASIRQILAEEGLFKSSAKLFKVKVKTWNGEHIFEVTPGQREALKVLPGGSGREFGFDTRRGELTGGSWTKKGGYIDAVEKKFWAAAKAAGFAKVDESTGGSPDGNYTSAGWVGKNSAGDILRYSNNFGVTARENRYSISLVFADPPKLDDPTWNAKRDEANAADRRSQIGKDVLFGVRGVTPAHGSGDIVLRGKLDPRLLPNWLQDIHSGPGGNRKNRDLTVNTDRGFVITQIDLTGDWKDKPFTLQEKYDPEDPGSLTRTLGGILKQIKNLRQ